MQTYDPLKARQWFKLRAPINWAISIVVFIPLVFLLQIILPFLVADAIAVAFIFCLYFFFLHKRAIAIECPHCDQFILTNTPWICGVCGGKNLRVDDFPFVNRCQECGCETKAYKCHHRNCGELIFFTNDKSQINYAKCLNMPENVRPPKKDYTAEKVSKRNTEKHELLHELEVTKIRAEIKKEKANLEPPKVKSIEDKYRLIVKDENDARKLKANIDEEFQNDPVERAKRHAVVDALVRETL